MADAEIGVIGIAGSSSPLDGGEQVSLDTPYGPPSAPITVGVLGGKAVAFLPRRGTDAEIPPPQINDRANVWAMKELGVGRIVAPIVCGSLRYAPVALVTDHDIGIGGAGAVSSERISRVMAANRERLRALLVDAIPSIGPQPEDVCATALGRARI